MSMPEKKPDLESLAREVAQWGPRKRPPGTWEDAPEAIPRVAETQAISIRLPTKLIDLLKAFAHREGVGYQVLIKRWLDDRLREEQRTLQRTITIRGTRFLRIAAAFPLADKVDHISGKANVVP